MSMTIPVVSPLEGLSCLPIDLPADIEDPPVEASTIKWKRAFDVTAACFALAALLPMILATVAALWILQGRPIFIRHKRLGQNGKPFSCFKFRTMVTNASEVLQRYLSTDATAKAEWKQTFKLKADPRVTPFGSMMRKSSLDELPQLWNILRGDMSFVGPRPIVSEEVHRYGANISDYYRVKPGLTGLWQVSGRSDTNYETRVTLDTQYARQISFLQDIRILLVTIPAVLQSRGSY